MTTLIVRLGSDLKAILLGFPRTRSTRITRSRLTANKSDVIQQWTGLELASRKLSLATLPTISSLDLLGSFEVFGWNWVGWPSHWVSMLVMAVELLALNIGAALDVNRIIVGLECHLLLLLCAKG
jgi:hypothetical protein